MDNMVKMTTVVLGPPRAELEHLLERRRALGLDKFDEVWEGTYHMAPEAHFRHAYLDDQLAVLLHPYAQAAGLVGSGPFNLGYEDDFRVPDRGYHRELLDAVFLETAAIVIEILSPDDETYEKLPFYAAHGVDEVLIIDPGERQVHLFARRNDHYDEIDRSVLLELGTDVLEHAIRWP